MKRCIVLDSKNWEGDLDNPIWTRIEVVDGKFRSAGLGFVNVSWWTWHFETEPRPSELSSIIGTVMLILMILGASSVIIDAVKNWRDKRKA